MLLNIKSPSIRKLILEKYIEDIKYLKLIKYNKDHQKKFNLSLTDYINYSPITIELIPLNPEKLKRSKNYFINFKKERKNFSIYFNDSNKKIEKDYFTPEDKVNKIKVKLNRNIENLSELFYIKNYGSFNGCDFIKEINFLRFNNETIEDMSFMFYGCSALININLSKIKTKKVKNMSYMFYGCSSLTDLDLSNFDTENVTNMFCMFSKCSALSELDFSRFNTKNVVNMGNIFESCGSLRKLKNFNFITNNVTNMMGMFEGCFSLSYINVSNFITDKVYSFENMFKNCFQLSYLDVSGFIFKTDAYMREMFSGCNELFKKEIRKQNANLKEEAFYDDPNKQNIKILKIL